MKKRWKILTLLLSVLCCFFMFACGVNDNSDFNNGDNNASIDISYNVVFKLKTEEYSFTYNGTTNDIVKQVSSGEKLGDNFLVLEDGQEIQNQEYKIIGWYYFDKNGDQKSIDKDTIISAKNLNIKENVNEIVVYAKIKKLWL